MAHISENSGPLTDVTQKLLCKACKREYPEGAKICINCGSPTCSFSRFAHTHRSLITAVGAVLAFLTVVALFCNVWVTQTSMETQRVSFVEQFQPRLETTFKLVEPYDNTLRIVIDLENKGYADALEIKGRAYYLLSACDTVRLGTHSQDRLMGNTTLVLIRTIPDMYKRSFILTLDFDYIWSGETEVKHFESHYEFEYDATRDTYRVGRMNKDRLAAYPE